MWQKYIKLLGVNIMNNINKTLYIPLYSKSFVSKKGIILSDKKAEEIWECEGFSLKRKSRSKWLAYFLAMRAAVFDQWLNTEMRKDDKLLILHVGCGMDSRVLRIGTSGHLWYDIDFENVINLRKKYYSENEYYKMLVGDIRKLDWLSKIPDSKNIAIILEGVSMYLKTAELQAFLCAVNNRFQAISILMDCYTKKGAVATNLKNPINDVGVNITYGIDEPRVLEQDTGFCFIKEHDMTPSNMINELKGFERTIFKILFAGSFSKSIYRMYEFKKKR